MALSASLVYQYTCGSLTHIITIKELDFNNIGNHISFDRLKAVCFGFLIFYFFNSVCFEFFKNLFRQEKYF